MRYSEERNMHANTDLSAVLDMERMSNTCGPHWFYDKHYLGRNRFYECEIAENTEFMSKHPDQGKEIGK